MEGKKEALEVLQLILENPTARCQEHRTRIHLFLNPKDDAELLAKVDALCDASKISSPAKKENGGASHADVKILCSELTAESQSVLKAEWRRVKKGEVSFRIMRVGVTSIAVLGFFGLLLAIVWLILGDGNFNSITESLPIPSAASQTNI